MIRVKKFYSNYYKKQRKIYIYIPPNYSRRLDYFYPVLYMQDGQNIFSRHGGSDTLKWNLELTAQKLMKKQQIQDIIVVGISNSEWREYEYTPTHDEFEEHGGYADLYLEFLIGQVKHYIDKTYRVYPFRENTAICGSSLGGLLALYAGITHPEIFGKIAAISPSLWWDDHVILKMAESWDVDPACMKIWLDMGYQEMSPAEIEEMEDGELLPVEESRLLCNVLKRKGFKRGKNLKYFEDPWGTHDEITWGRRMSKVLKFLF